MKTNKLFKNIVWGMTLCGALCTTSCTSFDELNTDPTRMDEVNPGTLLNPILYETSVYNWKRYNSYTYDLMQCAVSTSSTNGVGWWYMTDSEGDDAPHRKIAGSLQTTQLRCYIADFAMLAIPDSDGCLR